MYESPFDTERQPKLCRKKSAARIEQQFATPVEKPRLIVTNKEPPITERL